MGFNKDNSLILNGIKSHYKFKTDAEFARFLGIKPNTLHNWYARNTMDYDLLVTKCVDLSGHWLLTGEGDMLRHDETPVGNAIAIGEIKKGVFTTRYVDLGNDRFLMVVPKIPIRASAGYRENFQDEHYIDTTFEKHYFPVSGTYRGNYFAFVVDGDSMDNGVAGEAIRDGSTVTARDIQRHHWRNKFHIKEFPDYVIVHRDVILVKRIIEHDTEKGTITCHSLNPDKTKYGYADFVLNLDECLQILNIVNVTESR